MLTMILDPAGLDFQHWVTGRTALIHVVYIVHERLVTPTVRGLFQLRRAR